MKRRTIIFDLDGTLIDSRADLACAINLTRQDFGLPALPVDTIAGLVGEGLRTLVARAMPEVPQAQEDAIARASRHYGEHLLDKTTLYPGVTLALTALRDMGYALAVATNKPQGFSEAVLDGLGIADFFAVVVGGGAGANLKPHPEALFLALNRSGCDDIPGSWMAGDHFTDLEAGRRAGVRRCYCRYGFGDPRAETYDLVIDSLAELPAFLGRAAQ